MTGWREKCPSGGESQLNGPGITTWINNVVSVNRGRTKMSARRWRRGKRNRSLDNNKIWHQREGRRLNKRRSWNEWKKELLFLRSAIEIVHLWVAGTPIYPTHPARGSSDCLPNAEVVDQEQCQWMARIPIQGYELVVSLCQQFN